MITDDGAAHRRLDCMTRPGRSTSQGRARLALLAAAFAAGCGDRTAREPDAIRSRAISVEARVEPAEPWDLLWVDRTSDGRVWGLGRDGLYTWSAGDAGWTMVHALELNGRSPSLAVAPDGRSAVIVTATGSARWEAGVDELTPTSPPDGFTTWDARGDAWFAVRNAIEPDVQARLGPMTTAGYPTEGDGWSYELACSVDRGANWSVVDRFDGAHCVRLSEQADGRLTLLLGGLGVRAGRLHEGERGAVRAQLETLVAPGSLPLPPDHVLGEWLLMDGDNGRIGLSAHHSTQGAVSYETDDGGRTWTAVDESRCLSVDVLRVADGRVVRLRGYLDARAWGIERWTGGGFEALAAPAGADLERVEVADVDAGGGLLLLLESGALWSLPPGTGAWERVWETPPGRARVERN